MAISRRTDLFLSPSPSASTFSKLQSILLYLQRAKHSSSGDDKGSSLTDSEPKHRASFDPSIWKTYNSRVVGINGSLIHKSAWTVLSVLRGKGFEAYLVGGCVRDLLLKRVPKDFDLITTASLVQVKREFKRCFLVGTRFRVGHVHLYGTIIEVSSFYKDVKENTKGKFVRKDEIDVLRCENSMERDFTINGLFFDPSKHTVYDYLNGMKDLKSSMVATVIPAQISFKEDCARILRGLRIAARLGFELTEETANAVREFSSLLHNLATARLMLELNFMLAYGSAAPSIRLLQKYGILEMFLPFHSAYLNAQRKNGCVDTNTLLLKLFVNLDKLLAPDRPCDCTLWIALLAFHAALVNHPQKSNVVQAFSALLYHGSWTKSMEYIKEKDEKNLSNFLPEIVLSSKPVSEENLKKEITHFASLVMDSTDIFTSLDSINNYLAIYPNAPKFSGQIVIFKTKTKKAKELFSIVKAKEGLKNRVSHDINYELLKTGNPDETRFVLGKVISDTMNTDVTPGDLDFKEIKVDKETAQKKPLDTSNSNTKDSNKKNKKKKNRNKMDNEARIEKKSVTDNSVKANPWSLSALFK